MSLSALSPGITSEGNNRPAPMTRVSQRLRLAFAMGLLAVADVAGETRAVVLNAESQEQVTQLLQTVIQDYWNGGDDRSVAKAGSSTNVEAAFRRASKLMPDRLDLRFGLASSLLAQASQTNGQRLDMKVREALSVYQDIEALDTNGFEAPDLVRCVCQGDWGDKRFPGGHQRAHGCSSPANK
jgi:hypothetical protein